MTYSAIFVGFVYVAVVINAWSRGIVGYAIGQRIDARLAHRSLAGSMGRRGNLYDNAMIESFMKTLKVEGVYPLAFETFEDVAASCPPSSTNTTPLSRTRRSATAAPISSTSRTPGPLSK